MIKRILRITLLLILAFPFAAAFAMLLNAPVEVQIASDEAPGVEVEAVAGDVRWAENFYPSGIEYGINTLVTDAQGNVYAGGPFITAGGVMVNHIAKWDGSRWSPLGSGMDGPVWSLALDGKGNLYAGGLFAFAGGVPANNIAKWNGVEWVALGNGVRREPEFGHYTPGGVYGLTVDEAGNLYAGGHFTIAGEVAAHSIAKWDGAKWSALGSGIGPIGAFYLPFVRALAIDQSGNLYAGGRFSTAGGIEAGNIARWNGSCWSAISSGTNDDVNSIAIDVAGNIYAGGHFTTAGGVAAKNLAKWNGRGWAPLGPGISGGENDRVWALKTDSFGNLFVGGRFITEGRVAASGIARWNGSEWSSLGSGITYESFNDSVAAISIDRQGSLYAGGYFSRMGGITANNFAKWNGGEWTSVGGGSGVINNDNSDSHVAAITLDAGEMLYAAGCFDIAGNASTQNIAKWNGSAWSPLGSGVDDGVLALAAHPDGNLYAAGWLTSAGGKSVNHIAKWDGSEWSALGEGANHRINALAVDGRGTLYTGGDFTMAGGKPALHIAKWNGTEWSALGKGLDGSVYALAVDGSGNLYAGGDFTRAGDTPANHIAKWNGTEWSALGKGANRSVLALAVDGRGNLYCATAYSMATGSNIYRWDGTAWFNIARGTHDLSALAADEIGNLYAAGYFTEIGGVAANRIAKWNGREWSALGSGMNDAVLALAADVGGNIYAGGSFSTAGGKPSSRIAKWKGRPALAVDFPSERLQLWDGSRKKISSQHPNVLSTWGDRLVVSFPELGLYLHDGSAWEKLTSLKSTESVLGIGDSLYVDAGAKGVYRYKGGWTKIHTSNPTMMAACGEKLVANFPEIGLWMYDGSEWKRISSWTGAEQMVGIEKRLFVDFGKRGIYRYDGSWVRITTRNPGLMHAFGKTLAASIDSASTPGIYLYRNNSWTRISSNPSAEGFASTRFTLYIDRGAQGIARYEKKAWKTITPYNPDRIAIYGGKLAAVIPDKGLYLYSNPGWSRLSAGKDATLMQGVLFE